MFKKIIIVFYLCFLTVLIFGFNSIEEAKAGTRPGNARITSTAANGYYPGKGLSFAWDASPAATSYVTYNIFDWTMNLTLDRYELATINMATYEKTITPISLISTTASLNLATGTYWILLQAVYKDESNQDWFSGSAEFLNISTDADNPTEPGKPRVIKTPSENFYGSYYTKSNPVSIWWSAATDSLSGIQKYELEVHPFSSTTASFTVTSSETSTTVTFPAEGAYSFRVKTIDNAGNSNYSTMQLSTLIIIYDASPPSPVTGITAGITTSDYSLQKLVITWDADTQDNPEKAAGIKGYDISIKPTGTAHSPDNPEILLTNTYEIDLASFIRGVERKVAVRAVDNLNQKDETWSQISVMIPPAPLRVTGCSQAAGEVIGGNPVYPVQLEISAPAGETITDYLNKINGAKLFAYDEQGEQLLVSATSQEILSDLAGGHVSWQEDNGKLLYNCHLTGAIFSHRLLSYKAHTIHKIGNTEEATAGFTGERLPNFPVTFAVQIKDSNGNLLKTINQAGLEQETGSVVELYRNQPVSFNLTTNTGSSYDYEQDIIRFRLRSSSGYTSAWALAGESILFPPAAEDLNSRNECWIEVAEFTSDTLGTEIPLQSLYPDYQVQTTSHDPDEEGFYVYFDTTPPAGDFVILDKDNAELSEDQPVNYTNVKILFASQTIYDAAGAVDSGLNRSEIENKGEGAIHTIALNQAPGASWPEADTVIDWELPVIAAGTEANVDLAVRFYDQAGNCTERIMRVVLDRKNPQSPDLAGFRYDITGSEMKITWQAPENGLSYEISWPDKEGNTLSGMADTNAYTIDIDGYAPDTAVPVNITAIDRAGNRAVSVLFIPYTSALPGTLSAHEQGYNSTDGHYLEWEVTGGNAAKHILQILDGDNIADILEQNGSFFKHSHLEAHHTYTYRLAAYNSYVPLSGLAEEYKITESADTVSWTLANNPPQAAQLLAPGEYARALPQFSWEGATDIDGDAITYTLIIRSGADEIFSVQTEKNVFPAEDESWPAGFGLQHNSLYSWSVTAADPYGGMAAGSSQSFTVDAIPPEITLNNFPVNLFTNQEALLFTAADDLSGISAACCWKDGETAEEAQPVTLDAAGRGAIQLAEGNYLLFIRVTDRAGNVKDMTTKEMRVDRTRPYELFADINMKKSDGKYLAQSGNLPVQVTCKDGFSGLYGVEYGFSESNTGVPESLHFVQVDWNPQLTPGVICELAGFTAQLTGNDGKTYDLYLVFTDWAGNRSEVYKVPDPVFFDSSAPQVSVTVTGLITYGNSYYISNLETMVPAFIAADEHSGATVQYAIKESRAAAPDWYDSYGEAKAHTTLVDGKAYRIEVKAVNGTGIEATAFTPAFVYDASPPDSLTLEYTPGDKIPGEVLKISASCVEEQCPVKKLRLAIGSTAGSHDISDKISGNWAGWMTATPGAKHYDFIVTLPAVPDGRYYLTLEAENAAGLVSRTGDEDYSLAVTASQEKVVVWDCGPFTAEKNTLSAGWEYKGERDFTGYEYRIISDENNDPAWVSTGAGTATVTSLTLTDGVTYYFEVRAAYTGGGYTAVTRSNGVTVDSTPPVFDPEAGLLVPAFTTTANISVSWDAADRESGITGVEVLLESFDAENNRIPVTGGWISLEAREKGEQVPLLLDQNGLPLNLADGQKLYLTLRITNGAGLAKEQTAPVTVIDNSPPPVPVVIDQGDVINTLQMPEASWFWTETDPQSGNTQYWWTVVSTPAEIRNAVWYEGDASCKAIPAAIDSFPLFPAHGKTWYFGVRAVNGAGLVSTGLSNGITFDGTAPFIAEVKLLDAVNLANPAEADEIRYITDNNDLHLYVSAFEDISKASSYTAAGGTLDENLEWTATEGEEYHNTDEIINLTDPLPDFEDGKIAVFRAEVVNTSELVSEYGYSGGVMLDSGKPAVTAIHAFLADDRFFFDWDVIPSNSPVVKYTIALVNVNRPEVKEYQEVGLERKFTVSAAELESGNYLLSIMAQNAAGKWSDEAASPVIILDRSKPSVAFTRCDSYAATSLNFRLEASEDFSAIAEYRFALGTENAETLFTSCWISVFSRAYYLEQTLEFANLAGGINSIADGSAIYLTVQVKNSVGLWSEPVKSTAIIIDKTPASPPVVQVENYTRFNYKIEGISFTSNDNQSGITDYSLALVTDTEADTIEQAVWNNRQAGEGFSDLKLDKLNLVHGEDYIILARTRNGAGLWSEPGISAPVLADLAAPEIEFPDQNTVINDLPHNIEYTIKEDVSATVEVAFRVIYRESGEMQLLVPVTVEPGTHVYAFDYTGYGLYDIKAELKDAAGNIRLDNPVQTVRVNSPPVLHITAASFRTNPGRNFAFDCQVLDPDGDSIVFYQWDFGDGSDSVTIKSPTHVYYHTDPHMAQTQYTVTLVSRDNYGKEAATQAIVTVENTRSGSLVVDEWWSGEHIMTGDVTVPQGINLTIMEGTKVIMGSDEHFRYDHSLIVDGNLQAESGCNFSMEAGIPGYWKGILVRGHAVIEGAAIKNAVRGVAYNGDADVEITGCLFEDNKTGIHVYGAQGRIENCRFVNNSVYGIKEDAGADPVVINADFSGNLYDYYDEEHTVSGQPDGSQGEEE